MKNYLMILDGEPVGTIDKSRYEYFTNGGINVISSEEDVEGNIVGITGTCNCGCGNPKIVKVDFVPLDDTPDEEE